VILNKVLRGNFNRPHFHPYEREIYVVSGTWWVGTGTNQDPAYSVARRPGTYVKHLANQVHWDGTKDEDVLLMVAGEGPAIDEFVR
jgi:quercetin dioxygenase-like cupin family protein